MMLTIYGLPKTTKYQDIKVLIKQKCNITDFILDNLSSVEGGTKKVQIGVSDDNDGAVLMKCLDGFIFTGHKLKILPVGKAPLLNTPRQPVFEPRTEFQNRPIEQPINRTFGGPGPAPVNTYPYTQHQDHPQQQNAQFGPQNSRPEIRSFGQREVYIQPTPLSQHYQNSNYPQNNTAPTMTDVHSALRPLKRVEPRSHVLRSVEIMDMPVALDHRNQNTPYQSARGPHVHNTPNEKPVTIFRDNFQGPVQEYLIEKSGQPADQPSFHGAQEPRTGPWQQGRQHPGNYNELNQEQFGGINKKPGFSPVFEKHSSRALLKTPEPLNEFEKRRKMSPSAISPRRKPSPRRHLSPGDRFSSPYGHADRTPPGRASSPRRIPHDGRRDSLSGRRSPQRRSPPMRQMSPSSKRISPGGRRHSPVGRPFMHRHSPQRYSPDRRAYPEKPVDKFREPEPRPQYVRGSFEPAVPAPSQAPYDAQFGMKHGNVAPHFHEPSTSQQRMSREDIHNFGEEQVNQRKRPLLRSPPRYQSPIRYQHPPNRSRSPPGDRVSHDAMDRRLAPSNHRSSSSWTGGQRHSPGIQEAPPPPEWPGQTRDGMPSVRYKKLEDRYPNQKKKHTEVVWEHSPIEDPHTLRSAMKHEPSPGRYIANIRQSPIENHVDGRQHAPRYRESPGHDDEPPFHHKPNWQERKKPITPLLSRPKSQEFKDQVDSHLYEESRLRREPYGQHVELKKHSVDYHHPAEFSSKPHTSRRSPEMRQPFTKRQDDIHHFEKVSGGKPVDRFDEFSQPTVATRHSVEFTHRRRSTSRHKEKISEKYPVQNKEHDKDRSSKTSNTSDNHARSPKHAYTSLENPNEPSVKERLRKQRAIDEICKLIMSKNTSDKIDPLIIKREVMKRVLKKVDKILENYSATSAADIVFKYRTLYTQGGDQKMYNEIVCELTTQNKSRPNARQAKTDVSHDTPAVSVKSHAFDVDVNKIVSNLRGKVETASRWDEKPAVVAIPNIFANVSTGINLNLDPNIQYYQQFSMPMNVLQNPAQCQDPVQYQNPIQYQNLVQHQNPVQCKNPEQYQNPIQYQNSVQCQNPEQYQSPIYTLYLCKDNFENMDPNEVGELKEFLSSQIFEAMLDAAQHGWMPNFTMKGLQSLCRYEVVANDEQSRDWLIKFDFNKFKPFNVLLYTKEELWYERAAIWLPGHHSIKMNLRIGDPLDKLRLQNKFSEGLELEKWKLVKVIFKDNGIRLYIDIPPETVRALSKYNMKLSHELQKVDVFMRNAAVDKNAFDAGLNDNSLTAAEIKSLQPDDSPIPALTDSKQIVKIGALGGKMLNMAHAKRIRRNLIMFLYSELARNSDSRADFLNYGFVSPGYFGLIPENAQTDLWVKKLRFPAIITNYILVVLNQHMESPMIIDIFIPNEKAGPKKILDNFRKHNDGKGVQFKEWQVTNYIRKAKGVSIKCSIDAVSAKSLRRLNFRLKYGKTEVAVKYNKSDLERVLQSIDTEGDSYVVANMEIDSDHD